MKYKENTSILSTIQYTKDKLFNINCSKETTLDNIKNSERKLKENPSDNLEQVILRNNKNYLNELLDEETELKLLLPKLQEKVNNE